jgi:hypothetical protein
MIKVFLIILLIFLLVKPIRENFEQLFWNATRNTRNMSYDIRCEPEIERNEFIWLNATVIPDKLVRCLK